MSDTVFHKILRGDIPADFVYEDDCCVAIRDINPVAPQHFVVFLREGFGCKGLDDPEVIASLVDDTHFVGELMVAAGRVGSRFCDEEHGFRVVINTRTDEGTVPYLHAHVIGGRKMEWPPG